MSYIKVEMLSLDDFDQICRTCSSKYKLKSLYENIETLSMLESFTQMQFSKSDELPDKICSECLNKIYECYHFINNCKIIDEKLRKCLSKNLKQLEIKTNELHSSIDIEDDDPLETGEIENKTESEPEVEEVEAEAEAETKPEPQSQPDKNIKDVHVKQSEYYILKWGSPSETEENGKFEFTPVNNSSNKQDLVEQEALRRQQAMNKIKRLRTRFLRPDETRAIDFEKKIPTYSLIGMDDVQEKKSDDETIEEQMNAAINQTKATVDQQTNTDESHRPRAKLTLPHSEHTTLLRRNNDIPERIALRRALVREQMRKYRSKLTAEETAEHRAVASENMRKYLVKVRHVELNRGGRRAPNEPEKNDSPQIPLRLSEMAQTLLQSKGSLKTMKEPRVEHSRDTRNAGEITRFSLRPTKIPQVKRECYEPRLRVEQQQMKFRSWKRKIETPEEVTIRLAKNALQMKRLCSSMSMKEPGQIEESVLRRSKNGGHLIEESALRRAKAAGQIRQYRPMLRKNKNVTEPHIQTGK